MFNQAFFERDFTRLLDDYARTPGSETPAVEFVLKDGSRYRVSSIELVGTNWLSFRGTLHGLENGDGEANQVTCPYEMLMRINFLSRVPDKRVGFRMSR